MLRLVPLFFGLAYGASDMEVIMLDDNLNTNKRRVRVSFRGDDDEAAAGFGGEYVVCGCNYDGGDTSAFPQQECSDAVSALNPDGKRVVANGQVKTVTPKGSGSMQTSYNSTTGLLTISNRGGYSSGESQTLDLYGPGTLYTVHLDIEPRDDYLKVQDKDGKEVFLTGNYSACLRMRTGLETAYMDNNLAPENQYSESISDYHVTEETQNREGDLCHNILTGKLLMPAPIEIPPGYDAGTKVVTPSTLTWVSDDDNLGGADSPGSHSTNLDFFEGYELIMAYNDLYTADVETTTSDAENLCLDRIAQNGGGRVRSDIKISAGVDNVDGLESAVGTPPIGAPSRVYFRDNDLNKLKIDGDIEIQNSGTAGADEVAYLVTLEKFEPAGRWGYVLGQLANSAQFSSTERTRDDLPYGEYTVYGPRDTHGHKGAELPYYPTGGSTGTEAPDLIGGGPSGSRVFNKHGDVIPGSARGMHPDYQAAEELIDVESWTCICGTKESPVRCRDRPTLDYRCTGTVKRVDGEPNGKGLQQSQGSPPAPMYQLRTRSCAKVDPASGQALHCNMRSSEVIQLIDIAEYEPTGTFYGDLDPKTRVLQGEITVMTPSYAMGIRGYRAYPTSTGDGNLPLVWSDNTAREQSGTDWGVSYNGETHFGERSANPQFMVVLDKHCPPSAIATDWIRYCRPGVPYDDDWCTMAMEPCGNDNPYSPKCVGKTCPFINVLAGAQGEFYISRYDNNGNADNPQTRLHGVVENPNYNNLPQKYTANTGQRNYSHNEFAQIFIPKSGWLTPIMMDVNENKRCTPGTSKASEACQHSTSLGEGDQLVLKRGWNGANVDIYNTGHTINNPSITYNPLGYNGEFQADLVNSPLSQYLDLTTEESVIEWSTDAYDTAQGWTLIFQPNYPEISIFMGTPMAQGASGLRLVPVYHANPTLNPLSTKPGGRVQQGSTIGVGELGEACDLCTCIGCGVEGTLDADSYVETYDWLVPNVTCTPTTMHCPLPTVWAHINYTTPSLYPEPAEGSCLQQKTGTSSLNGCSNKMDLDQRWYSANSPTTTEPGRSQQNTEEEDNGQLVAADKYAEQYTNWAGNCGDATSYFWFEKIACGSTRTFHTDRSLIHDFVQLTPTWEDIQQILDLYYTTKAPLQGRTDNVGFTFITSDYHIPPVLPPKINCTCQSSMDAYASLLSVVSKTPTPGAPVTLDPEVLNSGTSKIVATLRMYQDPTYSIPASSVAPMPIVVTRFYLEVSTKFTRNRITISDCQASNLENLLNDTTSLKPRMNYCDNSTFGTLTERSPNGVTHMDRISMKKFKFQTTTDVFMQCKLRACAQQPCGICTGTGDAYRELQDVDLSPVEGEMIAPPVKIMVSKMDTNALVFPDTVADFRAEERAKDMLSPTASISSESAQGLVKAVTTKPIQVSASLAFGEMDAQWAIDNRDAVTDTLRKTLELMPSEELIITAVSKLNTRKLSSSSELRKLQSASKGVKIDYVVGFSSTDRANQAKAAIKVLTEGDPRILAAFSRQLDQELAKRGIPAVRLSVDQMQFGAATVALTQNNSSSGGAIESFQAAALFDDDEDEDSDSSSSNDSSSSSNASADMTGILIAVIAALVVGFLCLALYIIIARKRNGEWNEEEGQPDAYASKVANLDNQWSYDQGQAGYTEGGWGGEQQHWGGAGGQAW